MRAGCVNTNASITRTYSTRSLNWHQSSATTGASDTLQRPSNRVQRCNGRAASQVLQCCIAKPIATPVNSTQDKRMSTPSQSRTVTVKIEVAFDTDIQHDVSMRVLHEFLSAWKTNVEASHKKNRVTITYADETGPR